MGKEKTDTDSVGNQIVRVNLFSPILGVIMGSALAAGIAYGAIGGTVHQNTRDITMLKLYGEQITKVRIAQGAAVAERQELQKSLDRLRDLIVDRGLKAK